LKSTIEGVRAFLDEQHRFQARTAASKRVDPKLAERASPDTIEHNGLLIAALGGNCSTHPS